MADEAGILSRARDYNKINSINNIPLMSADDVMIWQAIRPWKGGKPYAEHNHHFYPIWLGGLDHGPTIKVRGFEHISILEPQLERFMYKNLAVMVSPIKQ